MMKKFGLEVPMRVVIMMIMVTARDADEVLIAMMMLA
jgi:hypothetical protein